MTERLALHDLRRPLTPDDLPHDILARPTVASVAATPAAVSFAAMPAAAAPAAARVEASHNVEGTWRRLMEGEDFWSAVQRPFRAHELTRPDLLALVDRGLQTTHGSYRALVRLFNMPPVDYKRFHAFLYQQNCNLPVGPYRSGAANRAAAVPPRPATYSAA